MFSAALAFRAFFHLAETAENAHRAASWGSRPSSARQRLAEELKDFRRHVTNAGRATYQARTGKHDDLVLAVAIALWWCTERRKHRLIVGPVLGLY